MPQTITRRIVPASQSGWFPVDQRTLRKVEYLEHNLSTTNYPSNLFGEGDLNEINILGGNQQYAKHLRGLIGVTVEE